MEKEKYVRKAILKDALELAPKMRKEDRAEILASDNMSPLQALVVPFTIEGARIYSIIGTKDEGVIGMFGSTPSTDPAFGVAWLLSNDKLANKHARQFLKECPYWVSQMGDGYKHLYNFVDKRNWVALKWLQLLGFEAKEEFPKYGHKQIPFLLMMKEMTCAE
jgi:hypothetical protein|tara:strand:+ start:251 stop:739 length:489 start_codon:yes stop_codon:yes gene_type:complete